MKSAQFLVVSNRETGTLRNWLGLLLTCMTQDAFFVFYEYTYTYF